MIEGGTKDDSKKLARFSLIPPKPLRKLAELFGIGAKKYEDRNWEKGLKWSRVFDAMMRHAWAWWGGEEYDSVDGQHHLSSVAWCAMVLLEYTETHPELDDRSSSTEGDSTECFLIHEPIFPEYDFSAAEKSFQESTDEDLPSETDQRSYDRRGFRVLRRGREILEKCGLRCTLPNGR